MELNLKPEHLRIVREILAKHVPDTEVWAYGSRIRGEAHDGSDLDLVMRGKEKTARKSLTALHTAFGESSLPIEVHLFDWPALPASFQEEIERGHVVLQVGR